MHFSSLSDSFLPTFIQMNNDVFDKYFIYPKGDNTNKNNNKNNNNNSQNKYIFLNLKDNFNEDDILNVQNKIKNLKLDILIFTDLHIESCMNFIALSKLANIQICTHGHPISSGLPRICMDYYISWDLAEIDKAQDFYSEELYLHSKNNVWEYFIPRNKQLDSKRWLSLKTGTIWGMNERIHLKYIDNKYNTNNWYFCPQAIFKFHNYFKDIIQKNIEKR